MPADEAAEFGEMTLGPLLEELLSAEELGLADTVGGDVVVRTVGDREVWVGIDTWDSEFWVDPETFHLVRLISTGDQASELNFDRWNAARTFKAPLRSKVVVPEPDPPMVVMSR